MAKECLKPNLRNALLAVLAEFLSTLLLILMGCLGACSVPNGIAPTHLQTVLGFGFMVAVNIQVFGHLSEAHQNPCLTLAAVILETMSLPLAFGYMAAQFLGAIVGYGILMLFANIDSSKTVCVNIPNESINSLQALAIEAVGTAILTWIYCSLAYDPAHKATRDGVAIKFGITIIAVALVIGPYSGGSINPARSLGPALWLMSWKQHWVYWIGPFAGTVFSAYLYKYVLCSTLQTKTPERTIAELEDLPLQEKINDTA